MAYFYADLLSKENSWSKVGHCSAGFININNYSCKLMKENDKGDKKTGRRSTSPPNFKQAEIHLRAKMMKDQSNFCCVV